VPCVRAHSLREAAAARLLLCASSRPEVRSYSEAAGGRAGGRRLRSSVRPATHPDLRAWRWQITLAARAAAGSRAGVRAREQLGGSGAGGRGGAA